MTHITQVTGRSSVYSYRFLTMILTACALLFLQSSAVKAQWSNGANINNTNNGTVSIGTTNPGGDKLIIAGNTVGGNISSHTQLYSGYDSQANVIMELSYGTATANVIPYSTIVLSKNLTSANQLVGVFNFANRSIADGSDKRIAQIAAFTDATTNSGALTFHTMNAGATSERMRISSAGNVGIGTSTPASSLHVATESTLTTRGITSSQHSADVNGGLFLLRKSRGTIAAPAVAVNGDSIGNLYAEGYDGTSYISGGRIRFLIDGPVSTGVIPTSVQFFSGTGGFGGIERMRINSSGNVGIGTSSPGYKLDIQGGSLNSSGGLCIAGDCKTAWSQVGGGGSSQWTTATPGSNIYYNSGNVGIGTAAPGSKLFVGSGTPAGSTLPGLNVALGGNSYVSTSDGIVNTFIGADTSLYGIVGTLSNHPLGLRANNTLALTVLPGGNVGIGTASPTAQLHIAGANGLANNTAAPAPDALKVVGGIGGNGTWGASQGGVGGGMSFAGGTGGTPVAGSQAALGGKGGSLSLVGGGGGPNVFAVGGGAGGDVSINGGAGVANSDGNIFLADLRGKVGIGTASPGAVLEVRKDQNVATDIYLNNATAGSGTGAYTGLRFYQGTTLKAFMGSANSGSSGYTGGANSLQIWNMQNAPMVFGTNGLERMRIDAAGNVGIGITPNSSYKLDVFGSINVSGNINAKYQDMAEWVESSQALMAGTVVVLDHTKSNQVIASSQAYDTRVAGVISLQPGITLGEKGERKVLVATTGRVRIKVDASRGSIQVGDLLVTSGVSGLAMKSQPIDVGGVQIHRPGTLIGKALEPLEQGVGEILVLLSLQ